jgi:hypothetical protein
VILPTLCYQRVSELLDEVTAVARCAADGLLFWVNDVSPLCNDRYGSLTARLQRRACALYGMPSAQDAYRRLITRSARIRHSPGGGRLIEAESGEHLAVSDVQYPRCHLPRRSARLLRGTCARSREPVAIAERRVTPANVTT